MPIGLIFRAKRICRVVTSRNFPVVFRHVKSVLIPKMELLEKRIFCLEHESGPMYLTIAPKGGAGEGPSLLPSVISVFKGRSIMYISAFASKNSFAKNVDRHTQLKTILSSTENFTLYCGLSFHGAEFFERCYFVAFQSGVDRKRLYEMAESVQKSNLQGDAGALIMSLSQDETCISVRNVTLINSIDEVKLVSCDAPDTHPAFLSPNTNSVYHDIQRCYDVLQEFGSSEEVIQLREICDKYIQRSERWREELPLKAKYPVIVIEGLDATGKTTLTTNLAQKVNGTVLKSPPECICHLRDKFNSHHQLLRRAYYSLGNYAFAAMIQDAAQKGVVIVDRFWNSTAAYAIATDVGVGEPECLPPIGHKVYSWPSDLLLPSAVFMLTVSDEERRKRLLGRGTVKTDEEIRLEKSSPFRMRLEESYNRMDNPKMQIIDASGTPEEVLAKTLEILKSKGLI